MVLKSICTAVGLGILVVATSASALVAQERLGEWSGRMDPGQSLEVQGINGNIRAVAAPGGTAEVVWEKQGRSADFEEVEIRVVEERDRVVVCAIYGSWNRGDGCNHDDRDRRDRDRGERRSVDVSVGFEVRVPAGVDLVANLVTGDVRAEDLESDVMANTVTGDIEVSTTGVARARTVTGSLDVEMTSGSWDEVNYSTVTGDITLYLPGGTDAEVEFESVSGDFDTDFPVAIERSRRRFVGSEVRGTIGDGGRRLTFKTVSGDVDLRRSGPRR